MGSLVNECSARVDALGNRLLKMKCTATPLFGSDIGDGFGEVPAMAVEVLNIVLALPIGMFCRFAQDGGPVPPCAFAVCNSIFDAHLNALRMVGRHTSFADRDAALPRFHLDPVIGNTETDGEAKSPRQPIGCRAGIRISEHRNYGARRHRAVESHLETLSLNPEAEDPQNGLDCARFLSTAYG